MEHVLLFVAFMNVVVAGINLVTAIMNYRNKKSLLRRQRRKLGELEE
ncbi:hypothetical protein MUB24_18215 [Lederbergia sp. NSJ-179]|nr:hypothetical protein [Lederbergia sp. NSJ-179]MCJ7842777.1 hypothetical protein [Lederbergia sp. NSJ-179]